MKKILILGAAFDPPHNGHMTMAREVVAQGIAETVIFVPCGSHAFEKIMSPAADRYEMTKMVVDTLVQNEGNNFQLSDIEIKRGGVSLTWETLDQFAEMYPDHEIGWLMGSDQLSKFNLWHKYEEMLTKYPFYVYPRKGFAFEPFYPGMIKIENVPVVELSSTDIRNSFINNHEITDNMVIPTVAQYIKEKKLWTK